MGGGGATSKQNNQIEQDRNYATTQGGNMSAAANDWGNAYGALAEARRQQGDAAYSKIASGGGGYSMDAKNAITDPEGLQALKTDTSVGSTTPDEYGSNYYTEGEKQGIMGDQSGVNKVEGNIGQNVQDYTSQVRMTPEQEQAFTTAAARSQANVDQGAAQANVERARSAGLDPLGVASYTARNNRQSQINQANAASQARVQADQERVARENAIEGVAQGANTQQLGTEQTKEANASNRAGAVANNRQTVNYTNQNQRFNQAQQAQQQGFNQGAYVEGQGAQRAQTVADAQRSDEQQYRQWLANQQGGAMSQQLGEQGIGSGIYSTEGNQLGQSANTQVEADKRPAWWQSALSAGAQVAAAAVPKVSDRRLKENLKLVGNRGPLKIYEYNFKGQRELERGFIAQEVEKHFPDCVIVGGENPQTNPWKVDYNRLLEEHGIGVN